MALNVDGRTLNAVGKMYNTYSGQPDVEFEFRVGSFQKDKFVPGVTKKEFDSLMSLLKKKVNPVNEKSTVALFSGGFREIRSQSGLVLQEKKQLARPVELDNMGRFTISQERVLNSFPVNAVKQDTRERDRYNFMFDGYVVSLTHITNKDIYEVEFEYESGLPLKKLFEPLKILASDGGDDARASLTKMMGHRGILFNNAVNMKSKYFSELGKYIITPKWDGVRMFMYIWGSKAYLINRTAAFEAPFKIPNELDGTVFDGEFFEAEKKYICFDLIFLKSSDLREKTRVVRTFLLEQTLEKYKLPLEMAEIGAGRDMHACFVHYVTKYPQHVLDGVVFAPMTSTYYNKHTLKYKPIDLLTIDFLIEVESKGLRYPRYLLFVGGKDGRVVPFAPMPVIQKVSEEGRRLIGGGGKIIECKWEGDTFVPHRVRGDKTAPNYKDIAMDIWEDINNPITEADMGNVLRDVSSEFPALKPYEGKWFQADGFADKSCVVASTGMERSLENSVGYAVIDHFQTMTLVKRREALRKIPSTIDEIASVISKQVVVYDYFAGNVVYQTPHQTEQIMLAYAVGDTYFSVGVFVQVNDVCRKLMRVVLAPEKEKHDVAKHYDNLKVARRDLSAALNIKKYNNWIKSVLISLTTRKGDSVLDLGSGRGGDLSKWCHQKIKLLTSVDISLKSLEEAEQRMLDLKWCNIQSEWVHANAYTTPLKLDHVYDLVSSQFSLHYAFGTHDNIETTFTNIASNLKKGGLFIATIPNADILKKRLAQNGPKFGNKHYTVEFSQDTIGNTYGEEYKFTLTDSVDACPEYIIDWSAFLATAAAHGLSLEFVFPFSDFYAKYMPRFSDLARKIGLSQLDADEQEIVDIYSVVCLRKK